MDSVFDNSSTIIPPTIFDISLSRKITFSFLVTLIIPSIVCSVFIIYHVIRKKEIRYRLYNHTILCIFFLNLFQAILDLPMTIAFLYQGQVAIPTDPFFIYPIPYSFSFLMFYPCENQFNYYAVVCGAALSCTINYYCSSKSFSYSSCYTTEKYLEKNSRMLMQLLSITGVQCIGWLPLSIISVIDNWLLIGCIYLPVLCSPITTIIAVPELRDEICTWFQRQDTRTHPLMTVPNMFETKQQTSMMN
ncbi:hypothetical protein I4U23_014623 [Adineta vaga]|nr:hypothetical protein I4U23_014623 [Adineta vaga]